MPHRESWERLEFTSSGTCAPSYSWIRPRSLSLAVGNSKCDSAPLLASKTNGFMPSTVQGQKTPWRLRSGSSVPPRSREPPPRLPEPSFLIHQAPPRLPRQPTNSSVLEQFCSYQSPLGSQLPTPKARGLGAFPPPGNSQTSHGIVTLPWPHLESRYRDHIWSPGTVTTSGVPVLWPHLEPQYCSPRSQTPESTKRTVTRVESGPEARKGSRAVLNHHSWRGKGPDRLGVHLPSETGLLSTAARGQDHFCPDAPLAPVPPGAAKHEGTVNCKLWKATRGMRKETHSALLRRGVPGPTRKTIRQLNSYQPLQWARLSPASVEVWEGQWERIGYAVVPGHPGVLLLTSKAPWFQVLETSFIVSFLTCLPQLIILEF